MEFQNDGFEASNLRQFEKKGEPETLDHWIKYACEFNFKDQLKID